MASLNNDFCKALYKRARQETGCPPCIAFQLKPTHWGWFAEVKDGSFSMEQFQADNIWDAKHKCVTGWHEQKSKEKSNEQSKD